MADAEFLDGFLFPGVTLSTEVSDVSREKPADFSLEPFTQMFWILRFRISDEFFCAVPLACKQEGGHGPLKLPHRCEINERRHPSDGCEDILGQRIQQVGLEMRPLDVPPAAKFSSDEAARLRPIQRSEISPHRETIRVARAV